MPTTTDFDIARSYVNDVMELAVKHTHLSVVLRYDGNGDCQIMRATHRLPEFYVRCEIEPEGFAINVIVNVLGHASLLVATLYRGRTSVWLAADTVQAAVREAIRIGSDR